MKVRIWRSGAIGFDVYDIEAGKVLKSFSDIDSCSNQSVDGIRAIRWCNENDHVIVNNGASDYVKYPKMPNVISISEDLEELQETINQKTIEGYVVTGGVTKIDDECYVIPMTLKSVLDGSWKPEEGVLVEEYI